MENKKKKIIIVTVIIVLLCIFIVGGFLLYKNLTKNNDVKKYKVRDTKYALYSLKGNDLETFDLYFLKLENANKNKVYSPLSIKYALRMLAEASNGETKNQILDILGSYTTNNYPNSSNMSFANALFIKDSYRKSVKKSYIDTIKKAFNGSVNYDSFATPDSLNSWVSDKTFGLINDLFDDISKQDFILLNDLAIDMEWNNKIQSEHEFYTVEYPHEKYSEFIAPLDGSDYTGLKFEGYEKEAKSVEIGGSINRYDIISELGEENIRKTVIAAYEKWLADGACGNVAEEPSASEMIEEYMSALSSNYKRVNSSTDYEVYVDNDVKVFAKDLKTYDGVTLQYVGIMPTSISLDKYIENITADDLNNVISNLKTIELNNFKDGVITHIKGYIPMFTFDYELDFINDLKELGITDAFIEGKADLSNLTKSRAFINTAAHKANIEFSNDGIKAAAATQVGGYGDDVCEFDYKYEVPVEEIDLTFDKPYMFIIRDKSTGEIWFTGTVYEPVEFQEYVYVEDEY